MWRMAGRSLSRLIWQTKSRLLDHLRLRHADDLRMNLYFGWMMAVGLRVCHSYLNPWPWTRRPTYRQAAAHNMKSKVKYPLPEMSRKDSPHGLLQGEWKLPSSHYSDAGHLTGLLGYGKTVCSDAPRFSARKHSSQRGILGGMLTASTTIFSSAVHTAPKNSKHEMTT